ncbi:biotin--protein ligase-like [Stegodyphus dumicola]|uniref:biotin--protein ligase-like n=1 Tax=Stegodyphus dumicola TaxID=202533 RepID=UPI0015B20091|nr:biotin--protein ligase-like [Stegodyphus dumicola]
MLRKFLLLPVNIYFTNWWLSVSSSKRLVIRPSLALKSFANMSSMAQNLSDTKSPNVLIYTSYDVFELFKKVKNKLQLCLHVDKYITYQLTEAQVFNTPWKENTTLLVVCCENISNELAKCFTDYVENGGKLIISCARFDSNLAGVVCEKKLMEGSIEIKYKHSMKIGAYHSLCRYSVSKQEVLAIAMHNNAPVIFRSNFGKGVAIFSEVYLGNEPLNLLFPYAVSRKKNDENYLFILKDILTKELGLEENSSNVMQPTSGYIVCQNEPCLKKVIDSLKVKDITIKMSDLKTDETDSAHSDSLKLLLQSDDGSEESLLFDKILYFSHLNTKIFGRVVVFFPVITTTMIASEYFSDYEGLTVIARRQIGGRGRSDNKWISPEGCAMFTLHFSLSLSSKLGQKLSILQHLSSLAIVHGIKKIPGFGYLDLRLKWPNDIYYGKDKKLGGVIAHTTIQGNVAHVYSGCGINVNNSRPTTCLNDIIKYHNAVHSDILPLLETEQVIACTLTEMENLVQDFEKSGPEAFKTLYYKYWMHDHHRVTLSSSGEEGTVVGLDDFGFLMVETDKGEKLVLQPDGNRFDIMQNLIISKS